MRTAYHTNPAVRLAFSLQNYNTLINQYCLNGWISSSKQSKKSGFIFKDGCRLKGLFEQKKYGPRREKTCLRGFANNKGADQPAHPRLISTFVIHLLESITLRLATSEIWICYLVFGAEETGLSLTFSETSKTGLLVTRPI